MEYLLNFVINVISKVASILLMPIDLILSSLLPDISYAIAYITEFMNLPFSIINWVFSLVHIPSIAIQLILSYWVFKYSVVGAIASTKYVITLYQRFKP